jgi:hypothetical protein
MAFRTFSKGKMTSLEVTLTPPASTHVTGDIELVCVIGRENSGYLL